MTAAEQTAAALREMLDQFAIVPPPMRTTGQQRAICEAGEALARADREADR